MKTLPAHITLVFLSLALLSPAASAQGITEMKGMGALSAGAGAGAAAAYSAGKKTTKSQTSSFSLSTEGLDKMLQQAQKLQKEKNWSEAEKYYRSGLTGLSNGGKFDAPQRLPLLEGMAAACMAQKKTNEAVGYYKTVVSLQEKRLGETHPTTINAKQKLADMFVADGDYNNAATYLGQAVTSAEKAESHLPVKQQITLLSCYSTVLRELGRDSEADTIETKAGTLRGSSDANKTPTHAAK